MKPYIKSNSLVTDIPALEPTSAKNSISIQDTVKFVSLGLQKEIEIPFSQALQYASQHFFRKQDFLVMAGEIPIMSFNGESIVCLNDLNIQEQVKQFIELYLIAIREAFDQGVLEQQSKLVQAEAEIDQPKAIGDEIPLSSTLISLSVLEEEEGSK